MRHSGNYVELNILKRDAEVGYHQGQCDKDIERLLQEPYIKKQFDRINPQKIVNELREYGAWDEEELKDEQANRARLLWLFCGDIVDKN